VNRRSCFKEQGLGGIILGQKIGAIGILAVLRPKNPVILTSFLARDDDSALAAMAG
jgi:hypothetical protein